MLQPKTKTDVVRFSDVLTCDGGQCQEKRFPSTTSDQIVFITYFQTSNCCRLLLLLLMMMMTKARGVAFSYLSRGLEKGISVENGCF